MNKEEMEHEIILHAKNGCESAFICNSDRFYYLGNSGFNKDHIIINKKKLARILDEVNYDYKVIFIHSHLQCPANPSSIDLKMMKLWPQFDWHIYRIDNGKITNIYRSEME